MDLSAFHRKANLKAGIITGTILLLAACGGDAASDQVDNNGADTPASSSQVVARVNGQEITMHQLNAELARVRSVNDTNREQISKVLLRSLVVRTAMEQQAKEMNLDRNPGVMMELQRTKSAQLARAYLSSRASEAPRPGRQEVDQFILDTPHAFAERTYFIMDSITAPSDFLTPERRDAWEKMTNLEEIEIILRQQGIEHLRKPYTVYSEGLPQQILDDMETIRLAGDVFFIIAGKKTHITLLKSSRPAPLTGEKAVQAATRYLTKIANENFMKNLQAEIYDSANVEFLGEFATVDEKIELDLDDAVKSEIDTSVNEVDEGAT